MERSPKKNSAFDRIVTREQMEDALLREEIIADVARQLEKDFGMWGMSIAYSNDIPQAYEELYIQVYNHIVALGINDVSRLKNLLYQIDINVLGVLQRKEDCNVEEELAHTIIERELQKVLLRRFYK
ncbi:hypothetical protein [uncultured Acetobacteroides sp.]|uniref:hypothetical protein n=1 Tax=uncultured Acetobacteroides sp. TaxID=1760811 RepID=UPI0029F5B851|nr:hypothetical protein [uncultured Acetobacteroides sp.]